MKQEKRRLLVQALFFAFTNGYAKGFMEGKIYKGKTKMMCTPGLNCYSCPGALGSCPIGSLQAVLGSSSFSFSCYVLGIIMAFGALMGRFICGWLCPFGLVQDLLHKIPLFKKEKNMPGHNVLVKLKYVVLVLFVIILPLTVVNIAGTGRPWFCEYICPSGTLLGGLPLVIMRKELRMAAGGLFLWKVAILLAVVILAIKYYRPFCKYLCPLGAMYGLLNPVSLYRYEIDEEKCTRCGACSNVCKMGVDVCNNPNSTECIRCGACKNACPNNAIYSSFLNRNVVSPSTNLNGAEINKTQKKRRNKLGLIILILSILMIIYGVYIGEPESVLAKAINICLECIGIG